MFDIWLGDINFTVIILIFSAVAVLPFQIILCFKIKPLILRLMPVILFSLTAAVFALLSLTAQDVKALLCVFFTIYAVFLLFVCGVGWGLCALIRALKNVKK